MTMTERSHPTENMIEGSQSNAGNRLLCVYLCVRAFVCFSVTTRNFLSVIKTYLFLIVRIFAAVIKNELGEFYTPLVFLLGWHITLC